MAKATAKAEASAPPARAEPAYLALFRRAAKDRETRIRLAQRSLAFFAWYYLRAGGRPLDVPKCHLHWYRSIGTGEGYRRVPHRQHRLLLLAPRAHGKTMVAALVVPLHAICFNRDIRILLVGEAQGSAQKRLRRIRQALESNKRLIEDFAPNGGFRDPSAVWTDHAFQVRRNDQSLVDPTVEAVGAGSAVTGGRFDFIIADDPESTKTILTAHVRQRTREWFWGTLLELLEPWGQALVIGTRKHADDLYAHLKNDPTFSTVEDRAIVRWPDKWEYVKDTRGRVVDARVTEGQGETLWPERWPIGKLLAKRASAPSPTIFDRENQNQVQSEETAIFKLEWLNAARERGREIRPWRRGEEVAEGWGIVVGIDPAFVDDVRKAQATDSDFFVALAFAVNLTTWHRRLVNGFRFRGASPDVFAARIRKFVAPYATPTSRHPAGALRHVAVENNSFGRFYEIGLRKDTDFPLVPHHTGHSKKADYFDGVEAMASLWEGKTLDVALAPTGDEKFDVEWRQLVDVLMNEFHGLGTEPHDDTVMTTWIADCVIRRMRTFNENLTKRRAIKRQNIIRKPASETIGGDKAPSAAEEKAVQQPAGQGEDDYRDPRYRKNLRR